MLESIRQIGKPLLPGLESLIRRVRMRRLMSKRTTAIAGKNGALRGCYNRQSELHQVACVPYIL